jgi:gas vesicle protein
MLNDMIKKLSIILVLCGGIVSLLYFTDLGQIFKIGEKVEEIKKETKEKIEANKKEVKEAIEKVENKIESNIKEVEDKVESNLKKVENKIKDLKKLKLKDLLD